MQCFPSLGLDILCRKEWETDRQKRQTLTLHVLMNRAISPQTKCSAVNFVSPIGVCEDSLKGYYQVHIYGIDTIKNLIYNERNAFLWWYPGLGLKLLREIARITQPTHIVHLVANDEKPVAFFSQDKGDLSYFSIPSVTDQPLLPPKQTLTIQAKCQIDRYACVSWHLR